MLTRNVCMKQPRTSVLKADKAWGVGKVGRGTNTTGEKRTTMIVQSSSGQQMYKSVSPSQCQCFGHLVICSICMAR